MSDEATQTFTDQIMADLTDRKGILDGVDADVLAEITGSIHQIVTSSYSAGASAARQRFLTILQQSARQARSDRNEARKDGLPLIEADAVAREQLCDLLSSQVRS